MAIGMCTSRSPDEPSRRAAGASRWRHPGSKVPPRMSLRSCGLRAC